MLFIALLTRGIYVLDLAPEQRTLVVVKGFLYFGAIALQYLAIKRLSDPLINLIITFSTMCIAQFFIEKHERKNSLNVWVMSLALIQMLLVLMGTIQPLIHTTMKGSLNLTTVVGYSFSSISGFLYAFIFTTNNNKSITEKEAVL